MISKKEEYLELAKGVLNECFELLKKKKNPKIFESVLYSSMKEMVESYIILDKSGYQLGASTLIRTMYESLMWCEARLDLSDKDISEFEIFLTDKQLSDYKNRNGKHFTFNYLHKKIVQKIKRCGIEADDNKNWDEFYKYLCGHTHISAKHMIYRKGNNQTITYAILPFGSGMKSEVFDKHASIVFLLVVLFKAYLEKN